MKLTEDRETVYFSLHFTTESSSDALYSAAAHCTLHSSQHGTVSSAPRALLSSPPQHTSAGGAAVQVEAAVAFTTVTAAVPDILPGKMTN